MESMLDTFVFETTELLENLDEILMRTEKSELGADDIAEIFRTMHTIKGSASMMGLQNMSKLAHSLEDLFSIIRDKPDIQFDKPALYELLFDGSDCLKYETENLGDESVPLTDFTERIDKIHAFADKMKGTPQKAAAKKITAEDIFSDDEDENICTYSVTFDEKCQMPAIRAMVLVNSLSSCAEVVKTIPSDLMSDDADEAISAGGVIIKLLCDDAEKVTAQLKEGLDVADVKRLYPPVKVKDGEKLILVRFEKECQMPGIRAMVLVNTISSAAKIRAQIPQDGNDEVLAAEGLKLILTCDDVEAVLKLLREGIDVASADDITPNKQISQPENSAKNEAESKPAPAQNKAAPSGGSTGSIISVKLEKLDRLLDLVTEIVITESGVVSSPDLKAVTGNLDRFSKSARDLKKLTDELQDVVMSIRMVPVQLAFQKMSRVVRDMNKKLGKNVDLVFKGADTEADKAVVDILGDPLMHIVRNAVDHGIETPEERAAKGKTEPARVILSAGYESSEVVISCQDNGAGMDAKKLLEKARSKGILTKPESEYTDADCFNLIMQAGFSTNEKITEYSGRGVGMDVVRKNIEKVGGKLTIDSQLGKGSKFTIKIPLSLSIIDILSVKAGESDFSIPISAVSEIFKADERDLIKDPDGSQLIMLRGKCLRVIKLTDAFELDGDERSLTEGIMLYCKDGAREAVIFADELTADQQVVVKPFSPLLSQFNLKEKGLLGCSILADGSITLITDIGEILTRYGIKADGAENE